VYEMKLIHFSEKHTHRNGCCEEQENKDDGYQIPQCSEHTRGSRNCIEHLVG
jgi:hypothetical protein